MLGKRVQFHLYIWKIALWLQSSHTQLPLKDIETNRCFQIVSQVPTAQCLNPNGHLRLMLAQLCRSGLERREIPGRFSYANIHPAVDLVISANSGFSPSAIGSCALTKVSALFQEPPYAKSNALLGLALKEQYTLLKGHQKTVSKGNLDSSRQLYFLWLFSLSTPFCLLFLYEEN